MNISLHKSLILILLFYGYNVMFSQQVSVDGTVGLQQLIENNLVQNSCVDITNISSSVNGSASGFSSYAYFEKAGSNFPFQNGIMLTTGNATSGGNAPITPTLSEGASNWGTDPDLEIALGINNTLNATSIEFDIVSISNQLQFNYLLASEEYFGINPCQFSDGFVFLIKETGSPGPYQNIAIVPGTANTPVNTNTIHDEIFGVCAAQNAQYFDGYNMGDTNYNGRTKVLTASTTITPNVQYHIKLIIADQNDFESDSAVFIEGDSFKILDLGEDVSTCAGLSTLNANIQNPAASYQWYLDNNLLVGEVNSTLDAILNGTYKVEVTVALNGNNCVEEDEIVVLLNTEESIAPITNYQLCDDASGNGVEVFDLSTKSAELTAVIPFTNNFSYHYSDLEARTNINPITTPISNTSNPQTIYVRIDDLDSNCFSYTTFNLIVNQVPNITNPTPLEVCDTDEFPDGFAQVNLNEKDDEITNGQNNLVVSYHLSPTDADTGNNPIQSPYINTTTPTNTVYVRVINTQTGCVNTSTLQINTTISPILDRDTRYIDACDPEHDGFDTFDLTEVIADIEGGLTNITTSFHESYENAQTNTNPITDTTNYQNTTPEEQIIYVRVEDNNTGCASIVPLEIHSNLLLTATNTGDYALCDNNDDSTDALPFYLNTIETEIVTDNKGNLLPFPISVTFYETEVDRDTNLNPIIKSDPYITTSPKTLYIKIENTDTGCFEMSEIKLIINPILLFSSIDPVLYCDTDDDGVIDVDLHSLDGIVTNNTANFIVTYYLTFQDAEDKNDELPEFYSTSGTQEFFARIESTLNGFACYSVNSFEIDVVSAPTTNTPTDIIICDNDQDGFSVINLNDKIDEAVASRTGLNISVHTSFDDADSNTNPIPNSDLTAYNSNTQTLYIRVEDAISSTGCYAIEPFEIIVNTLPNFPLISDFQLCISASGSTANFLLSDKDTEILNGQTGKEVFYFEDAAFTVPINKNLNYQNTSSPQTIYVIVQNITDVSCFGTSSFILQVAPEPVYNPIQDYLVCDDTSNDGKNIFNLDEKRTEITQGSVDNLNVTFHTTRTQAINNTNTLPDQYTNISNPQTLFVRIESSDSLCFIIEELGINIIAAPDISEVKAPLMECDTDYDGITVFNLETADFEIHERIQSNLIINYFENQSDINQNDGLDNSNEIQNPTIYSSNAKTVYIKVANTLTGCYSVIPLELTVILPAPTNTIGTVEICDNDTNTYDLLLVNTLVVNDTNSVTISYHNTQNDANININPLPNTYNYTASSHIIYVRVSDNTTGCFNVQAFILQINPNLIANTPTNLISCDDDFDGLFQFNLLATTNAILGTQDPNTHTVTFYNDLTNAENGTNALNNLHVASTGDIIYARLENNNTGCYDVTQFSTIVNPLPIIPINDIVPLCTNDLPLIVDAFTGNAGDRYLWTTTVKPSINNSTSSEIQLDINDIGIYSVTVTTPNNCQYTKTFSVVESEIATINVTTKVDFSDPNSITVDVSGIGDYIFILDDGEPQTSNVFENVTYGNHLVTVTDSNGCEDVTTEVFIIDIPKFFTPNNDAYNDTWHIIGIEQLPGTIIYIYNRYGKLIKNLLHTSNGWDGTYNGENMPSDDYWFVAKVIQNGNAFEIKGHFALKR